MCEKLGLADSSEVYSDQVKTYHEFSQAEDQPGLITSSILECFKGKRVLDLGCGTGKYLKFFAPVANEYIALDRAPEMLNFAKQSVGDNFNGIFLHADAESIPLKNNYVDLVFSSWGLGAIVDEEKRNRVLKEIQRVLKGNGKILLVENDIGGEFEELRGRYPDSALTESYHRWLFEYAKMKILYRIETFFEFESAAKAQSIFSSIWGARLTRQISSARIVHRVAIFG